MPPLHSEEFIEILNFAKDFSVENVCSPMLDSGELYKMTDLGTIGFMQHYLNTYQSLITSQSLINGEVKFLDVPSYSGKRILRALFQAEPLQSETIRK